MKLFITIILCVLPLLTVAQTNMPSWEDIRNDKDYLELQKELQPVEKETNALMIDFSNLTTAQKNNKTYMQSFNNRYSKIQQKKKAIMSAFVSGHPNSFVSLLVLNEGDFDLKTTTALYNSLSPKIKNTEMGQAMGMEIESVLHTSVGSKAPDFTQNNVSGEPVKLSDFKGKYVLVDFWASWCGPCRQENPNVVKAYNAYKDKNFTILGVSLDENKYAWQSAIQKDGLTWAHVSDLKGWRNTAAVLFGVRSIPQNFLIDPNGIIVEKNLRGEALQQTLSEIIK
jgi:peroxiredoxin